MAELIKIRPSSAKPARTAQSDGSEVWSLFNLRTSIFAAIAAGFIDLTLIVLLP